MSIEAAIESCSLRIQDFDTGELLGTGFLVFSDKAITCHHVPKARKRVRLLGTNAGRRWTSPGVVIASTAEGTSDLALIKLDELVQDAVCAWLDSEGKPNDQLWAYRFSDLEPEGGLRPFTIRSPFSRDQVDWWGIDRRPDKGTSGAAILNERTGRICGIVNAQREIGYGSGFEGVAVRTTEIAKAFQDYFDQEFNSQYVRQSWLQAVHVDLGTLRSRCIEHAMPALDELGAGYPSRDLVPSAVSPHLIDAWEEFLRMGNWRKRCARLLRDISKIWGKLPRKLKPPSILQQQVEALKANFDKPQRYPELRGKAKLDKDAVDKWISDAFRSVEADQSEPLTGEQSTVLDQLRLCSSALSDFRDAVRQPYRVAFLLTGAVGAGKSTFIRSVLRSYIDEANHGPSKPLSWLPLWINRPNDSIDVGAVILAALRKASGIEWRDLAAANEYLENLDSRVVLVVDDLHDWVERGVVRGELLTEIITNLTSYDSFCWLLTSALQAVPRLNRASVTFDRTLANSWIQLGIGVTSSARTVAVAKAIPLSAPFTPLLSGWHVLEEFNVRDEVGFRVLKAHGWKGEEFGEIQQFRHGNILNARPLLAVILCWLEQRGSISIADLATVSFPAFGKALESWIETWSPSETDNATLRSDIDSEALERLTSLIFYSMIKNSFSAIERRVLLSSVEDTEKEEAGIKSRLLRVLKHFQDIGIIRESYRQMPGRVSIYELGCEPFWEYRFARELLEAVQSRPDSESGRADALAALISRAKMESTPGEEPRLANGALQELLLLLDSSDAERLTGTQKRKATENIVRSPDIWVSVPLFAGAYGSDTLQRRVVELDFSSRLKEPLDYLALLFFSARVEPSSCSPATVVHKLQPHYEAFARFGFKDYLGYVLEKTILRCSDQSQFAELVLSLDGCEWSGQAGELARKAVEQILNLWNNDVKELVLTVKRYARKSTAPKRPDSIEELHKRLEKAGILDGWGDHTHFLHWLLHHTCVEVVRSKGHRAYDFFDLNHWYSPSRDERKSKGKTAPTHLWPARDMGKFANFALADIVWSRGSKSDYLKLVSRLANSTKRPELENAFFLIRHTEVIHSRNAVFVVSPRLRPFLEILSKKRELGSIHKQFKAFFEVNGLKCGGEG